MGGGGGGYFGGPPSGPGGRGAASNPPADRPTSGRAPSAGPGQGAAGGGGAAGDPCAIRDGGVLRSPDPAVVRGLAEGVDLDVRIHDVGGVKVLVAVDPGGSVVGVIDCEWEQAVIDCIEQGNGYAARIDSLRGGAVAVGIRRTRQP